MRGNMLYIKDGVRVRLGRVNRCVLLRVRLKSSTIVLEYAYSYSSKDIMYAYYVLRVQLYCDFKRRIVRVLYSAVLFFVPIHVLYNCTILYRLLTGRDAKSESKQMYHVYMHIHINSPLTCRRHQFERHFCICAILLSTFNR